MRFSVAFHHGGNFVRDWIICYKGGDKAIFKVKDDDDWGYAEMCGLVEDDLKVSKGYRLWWMHDEDINFRLVRLDEDAYAVKDYALSNNCVANIYVEHDVGETNGLVDVPNFVNTTQGCDSSQVVDTEKGKNVVVASDNEKDDDIAEDDDGFSSSEDEAKSVTFDDSEDERGLGLEDGFEVPYAEPKNGKNRVIVEEDIGTEMRWVFISDQQKGLMQVFDEMFVPQATYEATTDAPLQASVPQVSEASANVNSRTHVPAEASVPVNEPVTTQAHEIEVPVNAHVPAQAVSQDEPAQAYPVNPKPANVKPVNPKLVNPNPKPPLIIKPSSHIKTNVNTVFKNPTHVKTPSGSMVINPTANVTTCVKPYPSAKTVIKPSAHVNTFFKTYGPTNIVVNPNANVDTVVKPFVPVKPSEMKNVKLEKIEKAKVDLTKVRRSGRNIMKTNCNGPGKDKDCPIEINDDDDDATAAGDGDLTQEQVDNVGPCLKTIRLWEFGAPMM
ncbi:hypothetical protein P8452_61520 [Trifolium repens]|nr:hypothetical protein P8452_61520 [Trifolium repens]